MNRFLNGFLIDIKKLFVVFQETYRINRIVILFVYKVKKDSCAIKHPRKVLELIESDFRALFVLVKEISIRYVPESSYPFYTTKLFFIFAYEIRSTIKA